MWVQQGGTERMLERLADPLNRQRIITEIEQGSVGFENLIRAATFEGIQFASAPFAPDQSIVGRRVGEVARQRGDNPWNVYFEVLVSTRGRASAFYHMMSEEDVREGLKWRNVSIGSDSSGIRREWAIQAGIVPHPRAYGTFPRVLSKYVREERVLTLPEAIRRMTSLPAEQFGIQDRGLLKEGYFADIVVLNPATVQDNATFERPHEYPSGIVAVIVNGIVTLNGNEMTGRRAGRGLRRGDRSSTIKQTLSLARPRHESSLLNIVERIGVQ